MTQSTRRSGFRLPWSGESDDAPEATPQAGVDETAASAPTGEAIAAEADDASVGDGETVVAAIDPTAAGVAPPAEAEPAGTSTAPDAARTDEANADFLRSLVDAMRSVAEEERTASVTELRRLVDERAAQLETHARDRAEELRRKSELDITGIGEWQKAEIERINAEAGRKVEARRQQLEQQLADHEARSAAEVDSVRDRVAAYERELEAFFGQLTEIADPATFVAAARRMPKPPSLEGMATQVSTTPVTPTASLNARLAQLGIERGAAAPPASDDGTPAPDAAAPDDAGPAAGEAASAADTADGSEATETPEPAAGRDAQLAERLAELDALPEPSTATAPVGAADEAEEVATAIMVKGLGSFGAITSFKQRLERLATVRSVTLSLGPTGEFVYRATHPRQIDLSGAISTLEPGSTVERQPDGSLRVTVQAR